MSNSSDRVGDPNRLLSEGVVKNISDACVTCKN